jgi:hypothetical protein
MPIDHEPRSPAWKCRAVEGHVLDECASPIDPILTIDPTLTTSCVPLGALRR